MPQNPQRPQTLQERLSEILTGYRAARQAGNAPDPEELLSRHPDLADRLRPLLIAEVRGVTAAETMAPPAPGTDRVLTADPNGATLDRESPRPVEFSPPRGDFGDYELLEEVARGGMGVVFKARQKSLHRIIALKMILAGQLASPEQVRRFRTEAEEAGSLDHPNIVPIYQVGAIEGQHYFTMKLIDGGSLSDQSGPFRRTPQAAARLVAKIARAVDYAHQRGVLHRDLKPGNILIDADGEPHITDFGLAKHLAATGAPGGEVSTTRSGLIVGTPGYMAPEQAAARRDLTTACDVYGLGALLYELLTNRPPFQAATPLETIMQVMEQEPPSPRASKPGLDRDLETICLTCLAKDPQRRYSSALRLAEDLERYVAGEPIRARPVGRLERVRKWVRRRPAVAALVAVSFLAAVALAAGGWWSSGQLRAALSEAELERQRAEHQRWRSDEQREIAEQERKEANEQRRQAQANAEEAGRQKDQVAASFRKRLEGIDDFVLRVDGRLAKTRAPVSVRLEFLTDALGLSTALQSENKDSPDARRQAGRLHMLIGDLWRQGGDLAQAQSDYSGALGLQKKLAADFPKRPEYRNELAITSAHYALLLQDLERYADSLAAFDQAIRLEDELVAQYPDQPDYPERGAFYCSNRANLLEEWGKKTEAEKGYRDALKRQEALVARWPQGVGAHRDLATTATSLASLLAESNPRAAVPALERVLRAWRDLTRLIPQYSRNLFEAYFDLARLLRQCGQHAELTQLAARLRRDFPNNSDQTYNAACLAAYAIDAVANDAKLTRDERKRLADAYAAQAVKLLDMAVHEGYRQRGHMERDPDLNALRQRKDYQELIVNLEKRYPQAAPTPARELSELQQEYTAAEAAYTREQARARTVAEKKKVEAKRPEQAEFFERFLKLAEKHKESAAAVEALILILEQTAPAAGKKESPAITQVRERALAALQRDHLHKPELANVCERLCEAPAPDCERLLRTALEKHLQRDVRGLAGYALAVSLARKAEQRRLRDPAAADRLCDQAEKQLEQIMKDYAGVSYGRTTLGEVAKDKLYELRHLTVGRTAMEIEGEDLNGKKMKLSDFRGKVVVLDFWADWCGYCRRMYPHERNLVARLAGKPFALLGVNCDDEKATALRAVAKERMAWASWWTGGAGVDRLATAWQVDAFPTIFILDAKGVIRYKFQGYVDKELDDAVEKLLQEHSGG